MAALDAVGTPVQVQSSLSSSGNVNGVAQSAQAAAAAESKATTASVASGTVTDKANVSSTGELVAQALNTPDVRQDKVASLQSAIANGTYNVPASAVAGKIVDSLLK